MKRLSFAICLLYLMLSALATTVANGQQDYFTERFSSGANPFDLSNKAIMFTPTEDGTSYTACLQQIGLLPTDPAGGIELELPDDDYELVRLPDQKTVSIYGSSFPSFYVGSNGYITFTEGDWDPRQSLSDHFDTKRISALFNDFDPSEGGGVSWKRIANGVAVTWRHVPEFDTGGSNTFQVEMYFDGRIRLAWLAVAAQEGIVGLSNGLGLPADFQQTDLSAYPLCGGGPPINPVISGYVRTPDGSGISDVLLTFSNYGGSTITDSSGYYSNTVWYDWSGVVTPSKSGYVFIPPYISYDENVNSDISDQNYTGSAAEEVPPAGNFTEQFSSDADPFDLSNKAVMFTPTADGTSYIACLQEVFQLPTGGTQLTLADDGYEYVSLDDQKTVFLYGHSFDGFYVGSNGYITFTEGDTAYSETLPAHFDMMRISGLFHDFDPSRGGVISWKQFADRVVVIWRNIPEYRAGGSSTFQVEMYFDGRIQLAWLAVDSVTGIVGLSDGLSGWVGFQDADFSAYPPCGGGPPIGAIISGYVQYADGQGIKDVLLSFSNDGGSTTTNSTGYYSNTVWRGWSGVVTPIMSGYIFEPRFREYTNVTADKLNQDYTGRVGVLDYFTEEFSSSTDAFDLSNQSIMFTPTGDASFYSACVQKISQLPTNPAGGIDLGLDDDSYKFVHLRNLKTVYIFGSSFSGFYVGSNGYITFTEGDTNGRESLSAHFATRRISAFFNDLDPLLEEMITWKQLADRVAVTWKYVPHFFTIDLNTFQVEMYFDGRIRLSWLEMETRTGIVGLSDGLGLPVDFQETDLSMYPLCGEEPPITRIISGYVRTPEDLGISGVLLTFSNDGGSTTTDSSGYYSNTVFDGWSGAVTPSKNGYTFYPQYRSYSNVTSDKPDQNYTGYFGPPPMYFTEQFSSDADPFDLSNKAIMFTPADTSYDFSVKEITYLPTDPVGGTQLTLADDGYEFVSLLDQKTVSIFGSSFGSFYVGSNGYITFTEGNREYRELLSAHFATMRISALFHDFDPSSAGVVSWKQLTDRVVATWQDVPGYGTTNSNTFQVEMYFDGRIRLAWLTVDSITGIVGLSEGLDVPTGFQETDFTQGQPDGPPPVDESPIAHWKMDDNAANTTVLDSSGRGNHGTAQRNTSSLTAAGIIDGALTFDGSSDYINCGSNSSLDLTDNFTIAAWIKPHSFSWLAGIVGKYHSPNANSYYLRFDLNPPYKKIQFGGRTWVTSSSALNEVQWHFIVGIRDSGIGKIYINGSFDVSSAVSISSSADPVYIGMDYQPDARHFEGRIDDVRIYNRVLSETEITDLYNEAAGP
ncbi:MAG: LamG domain-containing protein [Phycisphaerae bacterium]